MEILKNHWLKIPIILYILGFLVHNTYLANFNSYEFELVQAKYILSGFGIVSFFLICFAFISIKVNLSNIFDNFTRDKLFPWLLRVVSLPYAIYTALYLDSFSTLLMQEELFFRLLAMLFITGIFVVFFSITDLTFMISQGNDLIARFWRSFFRVISIPMIIGTLVVNYNIPEFSSVFKASTYLFFAFIGLGFVQEDYKHGIEPDYLDSKSDKDHEYQFRMLIGLIAALAMGWFVISNYVKAIYPKIPVALGGARIENVQIHTEDRVIKSKLIQENDSWLLYIDSETKNIEKIKTVLVDKITYEKSTPKNSLNNE